MMNESPSEDVNLVNEEKLINDLSALQIQPFQILSSDKDTKTSTTPEIRMQRYKEDSRKLDRLRELLKDSEDIMKLHREMRQNLMQAERINKRFQLLFSARGLPVDKKTLHSASSKDSFDLKDLKESLPSVSNRSKIDNYLPKRRYRQLFNSIRMRRTEKLSAEIPERFKERSCKGTWSDFQKEFLKHKKILESKKEASRPNPYPLEETINSIIDKDYHPKEKCKERHNSDAVNTQQVDGILQPKFDCGSLKSWVSRMKMIGIIQRNCHSQKIHERIAFWKEVARNLELNARRQALLPTSGGIRPPVPEGMSRRSNLNVINSLDTQPIHKFDIVVPD